jgi:gliding motility-associated-like protein
LTFNVNEATCNTANGSVTVTALGATSYTYLWSDNQTTSIAVDLAGGDYTVTVFDPLFCEYSASVSVGVIGQPTADVSVTNVSCFNGNDGELSISVTSGTTPFSYLWFDGTTSNMIANLTEGVYQVTVYDASLCGLPLTVSVSEPNQIITSINTINQINCFSESNGEIEVVATGGAGSNYTYTWSNAQTTAQTTGLSSGTYLVTVMDENLCQEIVSYNLTEPANLSINLTPTNPLCAGDVNGSVSSIVSGGITPYNYTWSNTNSSNSISGLSAGSYTITVVDDNSCVQTATALLTEPSIIVINLISSTNASCSYLADGLINISATGGAGGYAYAWSNGTNNDILSGVNAGTYTVTITDTNGCAETFTTSISEGTVTAAFTASITQEGLPTEVSFVNESENAFYYNWDFNNGLSSTNETPSTQYTLSGEYTITLTASIDDDFICSDTAYQTINVVIETGYMIPIVFSPNNDGVNDIFTINGENIAEMEGKIFNRWGQELFSWDKPKSGWDGRTYSGVETPEGTYFYVIKVKETANSNWEEFTGSVTLVR